MTGRLARIMAAAAALAGLAALALHCFPPVVTRPLEAASIRPWQGHGYVANVSAHLPGPAVRALFGIDPDRNDAPAVSRIGLLEQGTRLGPAHSMHAEIAAAGAGRYSHWGDQVIFSASDNTRPGANGRSYAVSYALAPHWALVVALLVAGFAGLAATVPAARRLARHGPCAFWAGAAMVALYLNGAFHLLLAAPMVSPDSANYLSWSLLRTWGYPFLLDAFHAVAGDWRLLPLFQLDLLLAGVFLLAYGIARCTGRYAWAWLFVCAVLGGGTMLVSAADLLTEAPFSAFAMAHVAFAMLYLESRARLDALLAGLALAVAVTLKSVAVVLLGPVLLLAVFLGGSRRAIASLMLLPALFAWLVPAGYNYAAHGSFETSHAGGYALAGHVAWNVRARPASAYPVEARLAEQAVAPVLAERPARFDGVLAYVDYTANEYNKLLWASMVPALESHYAALLPAEPCYWRSEQRCGERRHTITVNRTLLSLAREAIADDPLRYLRHVAAHDLGLWRDLFAPGDYLADLGLRARMLPRAYDPANGAFAARLAPLPPFPSEAERRQVMQRLQDGPAKRLLDIATLRAAVDEMTRIAYRLPALLLAIGFLGSLLVVRIGRLEATAQAFCYLALCLNAYFLGTALAQPSLVRYAAAMQGVAAAAGVLGACLAWRALAAAWTAGRIAARGRRR